METLIARALVYIAYLQESHPGIEFAFNLEPAAYGGSVEDAAIISQVIPGVGNIPHSAIRVAKGIGHAHGVKGQDQITLGHLTHRIFNHHKVSPAVQPATV